MPYSVSEGSEKKQFIVFYGSSLEEATAFSSADTRDYQRYIFFSQGDAPFFFQRSEETFWESYHRPSEEILKNIAWETLFHSLHVVFSPRLTEKEKEEGFKLIELFRHIHRGAEAVLADVRDMGKKNLGNIVRNILLMKKASPFSLFYQSFQGVPAIICGAGPSLEKSLPFLPQLQNRALLLAGGSALNALSHGFLTPHFAAAIDPDPPVHLFRHQSAVEIPLLYQNRVAHHLLKYCHNAPIWVPDNVSYPIEEWLIRSLGIEEPPFEAGWNVATFCLHAAVAMGCNPIVLTGIDLCQSEGRMYATGISMPQESSSLLLCDAGKMTKSDFLLAGEWIEEFVAAHPEITFMNTSKSGLSLKGVQHVEPKNLVSLLTQPFVDLEGKIHSLLQRETAPRLNEKRVAEVLEELKKNITSSSRAVERMRDLLQIWYPEDPSTKGEYILLEVENEENPVYIYILQPLWNIWQWVLCVPAEDEPYTGFTEKIQKLIFFQTALRELEQELLDVGG